MVYSSIMACTEQLQLWQCTIQYRLSICSLIIFSGTTSYTTTLSYPCHTAWLG